MVEHAVYDGRENLRAVLGRDISHELAVAEYRFRESLSEASPARRRLCRAEGEIAMERVRRWMKIYQGAK